MRISARFSFFLRTLALPFQPSRLLTNLGIKMRGGDRNEVAVVAPSMVTP